MRLMNELTKQECTVLSLSLVAKGWRIAKIAGVLFISTRTVDNHLYHIFDKLGVSSRTEAALYATRIGLLANSDMSVITHDVANNIRYHREIS